MAVPKNTIAVLQKHGFQFKKQLGQNFLIDMHVLDKIIRAADIGPGDICLEIGPGIGSLTQALCEATLDETSAEIPTVEGQKSIGRVYAVEIDDRLIPILEENLAAYPHVHIIHTDFMKIDLPSFFEDEKIDRPVKVVANLPYYITTPIIMALFESGVPLASVTVMVQEEVARRMQAKPATKDYGALSLAVQYYAEPYIAAHVPPNCFMPRPNVGSAVIRLTRRPEPPVKVSDERLMFKLIRAAFGQRRKTLVNAVTGSPELGGKVRLADGGSLLISKETIAQALEEAGISLTIRGEALSLTQFAELTNVLAKQAAE
ncbi:MAG: 16S rRNA (adenine(1518)-N(6)/adenine(1519)-N(6))-dimethyltransferase RsmA [Firmicutes bacterium]|nr:16S rRNA (adenine(1518)-N(6)/adenine(1519)-N(6))-dimethyltransferase RsmA [Bacillota bacterium]